MRFFKILLFSSAIIPAATAQERIASLDALLTYADAHSAEARQAQVLPQIARQDVNIQASNLYPKINVFASGDYYPIIASMVVPATLVGGPADSYVPVQFGLPYVFQAGAELSIPLVDLEKWAQLKKARNQYSQSEWSSKAALERFHLQLIQQYYQLLVARELGKLNSENIETVTELVRIMSDRKEAGVLEPADYNRSLNLKLNTETSGLVYNSNILQATNALNAALNTQEKDKLSIDGALTDFSWPLLTQAASASARPAWQEVQLKVRTSELALSESRKGQLPKLNLNSRYTYNTQGKLDGGSGVDFETANIGVRLDVPVFRGNYYRSLQKKNSLQLRSAVLEKEKVEASLTQQQQDWFNMYNAAYAKHSVIEQKVKTASDNLRIARLNVKEGLMEFDEFNNIFIEYNRAKMEYLQNLADGILYHLLSTQKF